MPDLDCWSNALVTCFEDDTAIACCWPGCHSHDLSVKDMDCEMPVAGIVNTTRLGRELADCEMDVETVCDSRCMELKIGSFVTVSYYLVGWTTTTGSGLYKFTLVRTDHRHCTLKCIADMASSLSSSVVCTTTGYTVDLDLECETCDTSLDDWYIR